MSFKGRFEISQDTFWNLELHKDRFIVYEQTYLKNTDEINTKKRIIDGSLLKEKVIKGLYNGGYDMGNLYQILANSEDKFDDYRFTVEYPTAAYNRENPVKITLYTKYVAPDNTNLPNYSDGYRIIGYYSGSNKL